MVRGASNYLRIRDGRGEFPLRFEGASWIGVGGWVSSRGWGFGIYQRRIWMDRIVSYFGLMKIEREVIKIRIRTCFNLCARNC